MITRRTFLAIERRRRGGFGASAGPPAPTTRPGVTETEIKIGQTMPYSGPASAYGVIGRTEAAYFKMINEQGGVNGRKINLISLDDGYSPPKTVEQIRRLVEQEQVAFLFNTLGTPPNAAIRQYLNDNKVPQLFVATGAAMFGDPQALSLDDRLAARTIRPRRASSASTSSRPSPTPRSACSIRTTASARTI